MRDDKARIIAGVNKRRSFDAIIKVRAYRTLTVAIVMHFARELGKVNESQLRLLFKKFDFPVTYTHITYVILSLKKHGYVTIEKAEGRLNTKWIRLTEKGLLSYRTNVELIEGFVVHAEIVKIKRDQLLKL